ncbi:uncharacterized protein LOC110851981 isoform X2 [Folsomia candida]|uniref:Uncharacterized protein n=2 Tax=Folsomia candida TaxID=158441 RepID=A0A226E316_FOLCA|nr:uncharacterized protein LOC110851981 isoform X2 [Folsomia candida]OXA51829.1 hypothetical protein Fcan01_13419 [Folsomia candida]
MVIKPSVAQGFDAGPADPLQFGLIDPVILELGATYLYIAPFVVFVMGILVVPASLVFLFLIILPLYVPTSSTEGGARKLSHSGRGGTSPFSRNADCVNRIICEMSNRNQIEERGIQRTRQPIVRASPTTQYNYYTDRHANIEGSPRKRKLFQNSPCVRFVCKPYDLFIKIRNSLRGS